MGLLQRIFGSKPRREVPQPIVHPGLGRLVWEEQWWEGEVEHGGRGIHLSVAGDDSGPFPDLAEAAIRNIQHLHELRDEAVALILREVGEPGAQANAEGFTLTGMCHLWPDKPREFWLELRLAGDDDGIWRVEFGEAGAQSTGRDD